MTRRFKVFPGRFAPSVRSCFRRLQPLPLGAYFSCRVVGAPALDGANAFGQGEGLETHACVNPSRGVSRRGGLHLLPKLGGATFVRSRLSLSILVHEAIHMATSGLRAMRLLEALHRESWPGTLGTDDLQAAFERIAEKSAALLLSDAHVDPEPEEWVAYSAEACFEQLQRHIFPGEAEKRATAQRRRRRG